MLFMGLKLAVIGAGSTYLPELVQGFINRADEFPVDKLFLEDIDLEKVEIVGNLVKRMLKRAGLSTEVVVTNQLEPTLDGADFVFGQIRVGKLPARIIDEKIPLKHGLIGQETTGIGGFFKALRTIPVFMDIAHRMEKLCPDAFLINFSNPSGILAEAILNNTKIKTLGLCNGPIGMISRLKKDLELTDPEIDFIGLNHLSFIVGVRENGVDYFPKALDTMAGMTQLQNIPKGEFTPEALKAMGGIPISYLQYYTLRDQKLEILREEKQSRGEVCTDIERDLLEMYRDDNLSEKPALLDKRGGHMYSEAAMSLADAIYNDKQNFHIVNVLNGGAFDFMNDDDCIETGCIVGKNGAKPIEIPNFENNYIKGIMNSVKYYEKLTIEAALEGCDNKALAALLLNPLVGDFDRARACYFEMKEAHKEYLPTFM
jgi:6-phospho-beta-glucosidase